MLDLIQTDNVTASSYFSSVRHWGQPIVFERPLKTIICIPLFAGFSKYSLAKSEPIDILIVCAVAMVIQMFYAWRIWTLGRAIGNKAMVFGLVMVITMVRQSPLIVCSLTSYFYSWHCCKGLRP